jgi:hypothetical protein
LLFAGVNLFILQQPKLILRVVDVGGGTGDGGVGGGSRESIAFMGLLLPLLVQVDDLSSSFLR